MVSFPAVIHEHIKEHIDRGVCIAHGSECGEEIHDVMVHALCELANTGETGSFDSALPSAVRN